MTSTPFWKRPPEASCDAIWAVADDVLGPNGQVRLDDVAAATGIPRATVYYYFPGRDPFVQWIVHEELLRAAAAVAPLVTLDEVTVALVERWHSRKRIAARLLDGVGSDEWRDLAAAVARKIGGSTNRADALIGAVLCATLAATSRRSALNAIRSLT